MEYTILKGTSVSELSKKVSEYIDDGWALQGGVSNMFEDTRVDYANHNGGLTVFRPKVTYIQAMIKHKQGAKF